MQASTLVDSTSSSKAPSERALEDSITPCSTSSSSAATTPEPSSPTALSPKPTQIQPAPVAPFAPRSFYDQSLLPPVPRSEPVRPLPSDTNTPDGWIPRDERLIRLTGKHPFNVEPPLSALFENGFLTPQNLFYVRTHGDTPRVTKQQADQWTLNVHGLVHNQMSFTIRDLKHKFPVVTLPITLVCAGNRRKEQNMVSKGLGFNWGAAGVSTGLFTGVYLADVLEYCQPKNPLLSSFPAYHVVVPGRARHVVFEGADQLPKGKYGTSQRLNWAMDRSKGMILAWGLNGEDLSPDHGYPLRLVVPGQIGGRMVKWLERIEVSECESQHYLHFFDNKVLPTEVTADQARNETHWWHDPKYIINDLNVNAAICAPGHNQTIPLMPSSPTTGATPNYEQRIPIEGYAYTGGGKRINRVEVSFDDGASWKSAEIFWPEDLYRMYPIQNHPYFGTLDLSTTEMSFSWCFWRLTVQLNKEIVDKDVNVISVRAIDETLATMPRDMYWNAMSMMNSWWFRIAVHKEDGPDGTQVRFEHPTQPGNASGGWMQRMNEMGANPRYPKFGGAPSADEAVATVPKHLTVSGSSTCSGEDSTQIMRNPTKENVIITGAQLAQHADSEGDHPWFVIHGHVYDGTGFLKDHPGGDQSIRLVAGEDATEDFMAIHSIDAKKMLKDYHMGKLQQGASTVTIEEDVIDISKPFLDPKKWRKTKLISKTIISPDARIFRFALQDESQQLGLPVGQHVFVRIKKTNGLTGEVETVQRAYTPYSGNWQRGFLDILIKVYFPNTTGTTAFVGGKMTMLLEALDVDKAIDDDLVLELKGPLGSFTYLGNGQVRWKPTDQIRTVKKLAMIAGGSGITPIWSTLKAIADESQAARNGTAEPIQVWIIYGNKSEQDILIRDELDGLQDVLGDSLHIWHVVSTCGTSWKMGQGYVDVDCLRQHLPPPPPKPTLEGALEDTLALVCGPPPMEKSVAKGLEQLGWDLDRTVVFF